MGLSPLCCLMTGKKSIYLKEETKALRRAGKAGFHADWNLSRVFHTFPARELEIIKREYELNISPSSPSTPIHWNSKCKWKICSNGLGIYFCWQKALNVFCLVLVKMRRSLLSLSEEKCLDSEYWASSQDFKRRAETTCIVWGTREQPLCRPFWLQVLKAQYRFTLEPFGALCPAI